jgi:glycine/D-amino acid oxidase-like deaminating enzyme
MASNAKYESSAARPLWMQQVLEREGGDDRPPLQGDENVDVCIVGGGFTGLWTAIRIAELEPTVRVGVLESDICGAGASGANGGFAMTWWPKFATLKKMMSTDDALRLAMASEKAVAEIGRFCDNNHIDADFVPAGWLWTATNSSQLGSWNDTIKDLASVGATPFRELSQREVLEMGGSERHLGGVFEAGVATVQPAALVRGLRSAAIAAGVRIWEKTPMLDFNVSSQGVKVSVPGGMVSADQLVLTTNAWLARYKEIRQHLLVLGSDVIATDAVPERLAAVGWTPGLAISDSRRMVHYYRPTNDGRVVFGKGGGRLGFRAHMNRSLWATPLRGPQVIDQFRRTYPTLSDVAITNTWSGAVDYSSDSLPFFGTLGGSERVHYGVGFSGNGVGPSYVGGQILASRVLGRDDEWGTSPMIRTPQTALPPEPFRTLGGHVVRAAMRSKESSEDQGKNPSRLVRRITELDPTSFVG